MTTKLTINSTFNQNILQATDEILKSNGSGISMMINNILHQVLDDEDITTINVPNYFITNEDLTSKVYQKYNVDIFGTKYETFQSRISIELNPKLTHISDEYGLEKLENVMDDSFWSIDRIFDYIVYGLIFSEEKSIQIHLTPWDIDAFRSAMTDIQMHEIGL